MYVRGFGRLAVLSLALLVAAALAIGCSSGSTTTLDGWSSTDQYDAAVPDEQTPPVDSAPEMWPYDGKDDPDEKGGDDLTDIDQGEVSIICTGPGEFLCPCEDNSDCVSGYCVETQEGKVCTKSCVEDCPLGWACLQDENVLPDLAFICLPQNVYLCDPCNENDQCHSSYANDDDLCVSHGDNGSFCGIDCSFDGVCPDGYVCAEFLTDTGTTANQCVPAGGECECTPRATKNGAWTECRKVNGYGECSGKRTCGPDGLTDCDATTPKPEECNDIDDNCDGEIDPPNSLKCITWYYDQDGDGYGIGAGSCECSAPDVHHVAMGGDCDDSNIGVNPAVTEACNFVDDNCDGQTDEPFADGCEVMYYDGDSDGWGDASQTNCLCKATDEYAEKAGDCNDSNPVTHPEADELCDGEDNNCDDVIDEENALGCVPYYLDQDKDGYGLTDQLKCLCEKIGDYTATKGGDCDDTEYNVHPTVVELCDGIDNDCDGEIDEDEAVVTCGVVAHGEVICDGGCVISGCDPGYYDLNAAFADGCECQLEANEILTQTCGDATFIGELADAGSSYSATAKVVPIDDSDWYKFKAIDGLDPEGCDTFHIRVRFLKNPNDAYLFDVYQGGCAGADNMCAETTLFEFYTDFHVATGEVGAIGGECKCKPDANHTLTPTMYKDDTDANTHKCTDQTNEYSVRVYRKTGAPVACDEYQIEFSNGIAE